MSRFLCILCVLGAALCLGTPASTHADQDDELVGARLGAEIGNATDCLTELGEAILSAQQLNPALGLLADSSRSLLVGELAAGQRASTMQFLNPGEKLLVIGRTGGSGGDLDIRVFDPNGVQIEQDLQRDKQPIVVVEAKLRGNYRIELCLCETLQPGVKPFCGLALLEPGGRSVSREQFQDVVKNLFATQVLIGSKLWTVRRQQIRLQADPECWAMIGGVMDRETTFGYRVEVTRGSERIIVAVADSNAVDLDLAVQTSLGTRLKDILPDAQPIVELKVLQPQTYNVEVGAPLLIGKSTLVIVHEVALR